MRDQRVVCFGDSITRAAEFAERQRWPELVKAALDAWRPGRYHVYNRGVGGHTTAQGFDRLESDVIPLLPAVVLVQFGFNDANVRDWARVPRVSLGECQRNLREFHRIIHAGGGTCVFIVNHTVGRVSGVQGNARSYADNVAPYNAIVREVAQEYTAPCIDLPALMDQHGLTPRELVSSDGVHLTSAGNRHYAELVLAVLIPLLERLHREPVTEVAIEAGR